MQSGTRWGHEKIAKIEPFLTSFSIVNWLESATLEVMDHVSYQEVVLGLWKDLQTKLCAKIAKKCPNRPWL